MAAVGGNSLEPELEKSLALISAASISDLFLFSLFQEQAICARSKVEEFHVVSEHYTAWSATGFISGSFTQLNARTEIEQW